MMMTLAEIQASGRPLFRPVVLGVMGHDRMATWWGFPVEQATCSIFFRCIWAFLSTLEPCQIFNIQIWLAVWPTLKVFWFSHGDGKDIVNDDADDDGLVAALLVYRCWRVLFESVSLLFHFLTTALCFRKQMFHAASPLFKGFHRAYARA